MREAEQHYQNTDRRTHQSGLAVRKIGSKPPASLQQSPRPALSSASGEDTISLPDLPAGTRRGLHKGDSRSQLRTHSPKCPVTVALKRGHARQRSVGRRLRAAPRASAGWGSTSGASQWHQPIQNPSSLIPSAAQALIPRPVRLPAPTLAPGRTSWLASPHRMD